MPPDMVECDEETFRKPAFDLIIGAKTMTELGIILDFKEQIITIGDQIACAIHQRFSIIR